MSSQPLPQTRTLLERMLVTCDECHASVFRAAHRDEARRDLLEKALKGTIKLDVMEKRRLELEAAANAEIDRGISSVEFLVPFFDKELYRDAQLKIEFGECLGEVGNQRMYEDVNFVSLIACGYDAIVQGQLARLECLRELRERIVDALEGGSRPRWDGETGMLLFRGETVRKVRGKSVARSIRLILDEFQRLDWPKRIQANSDFSPEVTRETVRSLNRGLSLLRFHSDKDGKVVFWEVI